MIHLQGHYSKPFSISKGTRQGCPLSPLIFAIAIETLAIAIRSNSNIRGVLCGAQTYKCGLFADDMLLFITSPIASLPNLCKTLKDFTKVSGLRVNYANSHALNISLKPDTVVTLQGNFDFRWKDTSL